VTDRKGFGVVTNKLPEPRSYDLKMDDGATLRRNRLFISPCPPSTRTPNRPPPHGINEDVPDMASGHLEEKDTEPNSEEGERPSQGIASEGLSRAPRAGLGQRASLKGWVAGAPRQHTRERLTLPAPQWVQQPAPPPEPREVVRSSLPRAPQEA